MKNPVLQFSIAALLALSCLLAVSIRAATPKKLLVVSVTKGFRHSSIPVAEKTLAELGQKSGAFNVEYVRTDEEMAQKMTAAALQQYDGVIFANTTGDLPLPDKQAFLDWIKSGKAFVGMHSASDTFPGFRPYIEMLGGEFETHHAQVRVECRNHDPKHPATRPLGATYTVFDEIYLQKNFHREMRTRTKRRLAFILSHGANHSATDASFTPPWVIAKTCGTRTGRTKTATAKTPRKPAKPIANTFSAASSGPSAWNRATPRRRPSNCLLSVSRPKPVTYEHEPSRRIESPRFYRLFRHVDDHAGRRGVGYPHLRPGR